MLFLKYIVESNFIETITKHTWRSWRFRTNPTVFCKSWDPKPNRLNRDVDPETDALFCEVASFDETT